MEKIVRVENMTFEYPPAEEGGKPSVAVDDVSLSVEAGSFTAVLGRNGSGKSTLSKNLNALLVPTEGDVFVCGMNTRDDDLVWDPQKCGHGVPESGQSAGFRRGGG